MELSRKSRLVYFRNELGWPKATVLALVSVGLATAARAVLGLIGPTLSFATFFPAVLVCALAGGRRAGLIAIPLSIVAVWWRFVDPNISFGPLTPVVLANFAVFSASSLVVVWLALIHRRLVFDLEAEEQERRMLAHEIQHRQKNFVALIASLVRQTVKDKQDAVDLLNRIHVVSSADAFLDPGRASILREVLEVNVKNAYPDQVDLDGPDVRLTSVQTRNLALVFHEMMTNAAKYGSLSRRNGRVRLSWTHANRTLKIDWQEIDGPEVSEPAKSNFGSKLIVSLLKQIGAELEPSFARSGYCFSISIPMD